LVVAALAFSAWLIHMGQTIWGVAFLIASIGGLIGTAIYGHKARSGQQQGAPDAEPSSAPQIETRQN
jgi:hypothetical protein